MYRKILGFLFARTLSNGRRPEPPPLKPTKPKSRFRNLYLPILVLIALVILLSIVDSIKNHTSRFSQIAVVELSGVILESESLITTLESLRENPRVKAVLIKVNTPGGGVTPSFDIYGAVAKLSALKPVYISMGGMATSGGYMVSAPATKIFGNTMGITGSIGVIFNSYRVDALLNKVGVAPIVIKSGKMKDMMSPTKQPTDAELKLVQDLVDETHQVFIELVKKHRHHLTGKPEELFDGRIFSNPQAVAKGLIDATGNYQDTLEALRKDFHLESAEVVYQEEFADSLRRLESLADHFSFALFAQKTYPGLMAIYVAP